MRAAHRKTAIVAAVATAVLGAILVASPLGHPLIHWSYDLLQAFLPTYRYTDVVIIHMDEQAMRDYGQKSGQLWPRSIHAGLLDRLSKDKPRVVVFDVAMTQPSEPAEDNEFARALQQNGRVVLAGDRVPVSGIPQGYTIVPPLEQFETNAARRWGLAKVVLDSDRVVRRYDAGDDQEPSLAWAAAAVAEAPVTLNPQRRLEEERWLNYYSSARPFQTMSMTYTNAVTSETNFFRDKAVFIGGKPQTLMREETTDVFSSPFTKSKSGFTPGVEVTAIAYANLMHNEWLRRPGKAAELGLLLMVGAAIGFGLQCVPLRIGIWLSFASFVLFAIAAIVLVLYWRIWFSWAIIGLAQVPCALLFRFIASRTADLAALREFQSRPETPLPSLTPTRVDPPGQLEIPDHTLIRCIGEGAYGQVWVARNAIGLYHAVKVVYRSRFGNEGPYERALRGIQKFMPVSRSHEGFVHILHVGRNEGFFFYIMEAGDDQTAGQQFDPNTYAPKTLASELKERAMIPPRECLEFMLAVTEAVERLHQHQLIHRDIKPSNIIFVNHRPKLADIDLVTDIAKQGEVSRIGTEGYMAPEGPGTAASDVFSLGRILYVALTGKGPDQCPELPTRVSDHPDCGLLMELITIVCKASEFDLRRRYVSAGLMRADLLEISRRWKAAS